MKENKCDGQERSLLGDTLRLSAVREEGVSHRRDEEHSRQRKLRAKVLMG